MKATDPTNGWFLYDCALAGVWLAAAVLFGVRSLKASGNVGFGLSVLAVFAAGVGALLIGVAIGKGP